MEFGTPDHELTLKNYIISLIVQEAQADQSFFNIEKNYLVYAIKILGLSEKEVEAVRLNPAHYVMSPPPSEQVRMNVLYFLLFMMKADGQIKKEEEAICHHIGFRLGFRREMISDLISVMQDCLYKEIPPDAMVGRIRAYLN